MAMNAIVDVRRDVQFIQSESTQFYHARKPEELEIAYFLNEKRFLSLDLTYAFPLTAGMFRFLMDHGMEEEEFDWFQNQTIKAHCIMGNDYYARNEHVVGDLPKIGERKDPHSAEGRDGGKQQDSVALGYYALAKQYYDRYKLPIMHTETNMADPDAVAWLWQNWSSVFRLYQEGVPIHGFTWYSLIDQVDWDTALTDDAGRVNPYGLYDMDRNIRPVGKAYKELISDWKGKFPGRAAYLRQSRW
jgi:beta-glucosidase/6-phospho-beta-glucosidase/beta-galactosidase